MGLRGHLKCRTMSNPRSGLFPIARSNPKDLCRKEQLQTSFPLGSTVSRFWLQIHFPQKGYPNLTNGGPNLTICCSAHLGRQVPVVLPARRQLRGICVAAHVPRRPPNAGLRHSHVPPKQASTQKVRLRIDFELRGRCGVAPLKARPRAKGVSTQGASYAG